MNIREDRDSREKNALKYRFLMKTRNSKTEIVRLTKIDTPKIVLQLFSFVLLVIGLIRPLVGKLCMLQEVASLEDTL